MTMPMVAVVSSVFAALLGFAALLVPAQFVAAFGVERLPEAGLLTTRLFGGHLVALATIDWFARNDLRGGNQPGAERGIVLGNLLSLTIGLILVVAAILAGVINEVGWLNVATLALVAAAWLYFGLLGPERPIRPPSPEG